VSIATAPRKRVKTTPNRFYIYALRLIKRSKYSIDIQGSRYLFDILTKGAIRLKEESDKLPKVTRTGRVRKRGLSAGSREYKVLENRYYNIIKRLIVTIIENKEKLGAAKLIFHFDIEAALKDLCPIWPLC
jgi:hypothetical protein